MLKNRTISIINVIGLSFSVAFCLLLFFYIRNEQSYDRFPENKDRLSALKAPIHGAVRIPNPPVIFSVFLQKIMTRTII
jgi:putative ABC transport system permease protein